MKIEASIISQLYTAGYLSEDQRRYTDQMLGLPIREDGETTNLSSSEEVRSDLDVVQQAHELAVRQWAHLRQNAETETGTKSFTEEAIYVRLHKNCVCGGTGRLIPEYGDEERPCGFCLKNKNDKIF